ncbi:MAG: 5-methylcytosine restriction system specificity protein McrC [Candidatus Dormibacteria bacterium]
MAESRVSGAVATGDVPRHLPRTSVTLAERGSQDISPAVWAILAQAPSFWTLVDRGVLSVAQISPGTMRLSAGPYVGRALVADVLIEVVEKVAGSLQSLVIHAASSAFKVTREPTIASEVGGLTKLLVRAFLERVSEYLGSGREFHYVPLAAVGPLAGGRLLVGRTANLWARGLIHQLAFERTLPTRRTRLNRVILATLREVEEIATDAELTARDILTLRTYEDIFTDCLDREVIFEPAAVFAAEADSLARDITDERIEDMLTLAAVLLAHEGFEPHPTLQATVPRTWFLNLENLFQREMRRVLDAASRPWLRADTAATWQRSLFDGLPGPFRVFPDFVLHHEGEFFCVGDAKYKTLDGPPLAADVYQLLAHAAAFDTDRCFLAYPGSTFGATHLGQSVTGCDTWVFTVDLAAAADSASAILRALDLA